MFLKRSVFSLFLLIVLIAGWLSYIGGEYRARHQPPGEIIFSDLTAEYAWAMDAVLQLTEKNILSGMTDDTFAPNESVTREQFAKVLVAAFGIPISEDKTQIFEDVPASRWSFSYCKAAKDTMGIYDVRFQPIKVVTREEAASSIVKALNLTGETVANSEVLEQTFEDGILVAPDLEKFVSIAYEKGLISGIDGKLKPFDAIRRLDMAVMVHRGMALQKDNPKALTSILGQTETTVQAAKAWAKNRGADQRFIEIADYYWNYGKQTGIRPEVLYAQAAKETNFGKYTGNVKPQMNNWAGIKKADATGDATEAHEVFASPDDGVIAHFNHMAAYVGLSTIGSPHGRYEVVKKQPWAGTIQYVEDLGGKWAPDSEYGKSIINDYLADLLTTKP